MEDADDDALTWVMDPRGDRWMLAVRRSVGRVWRIGWPGFALYLASVTYLDHRGSHTRYTLPRRSQVAAEIWCEDALHALAREVRDPWRAWRAARGGQLWGVRVAGYVCEVWRDGPPDRPVYRARIHYLDDAGMEQVDPCGETFATRHAAQVWCFDRLRWYGVNVPTLPLSGCGVGLAVSMAFLVGALLGAGAVLVVAGLV